MKNKKKLIEIAVTSVVSIILIVAVVMLAIHSDKKQEQNGPDNNNNNSNGNTNNNQVEDGHYYSELFQEDIMDIKISMSEDDTFLMWETPSEDNYYYSDISINGIAWKNVAIRVRGKKNTEAVFNEGHNKYSYKLDFNEFDKDNKFYKLDGLYLHNMIEDDSYIAQYVSYELAKELGAVIPFYTLAKVQINDGPIEWYMVTEEMNNSFAKRVTDDDGTVVLYDAANEDALLASTDSVANYEVEYGEDILPSYLDKLIELLNDPDSTEAQIEAVLNVESVLKAMAINYVVGNYAGYQGPDPDNFCLLYDNGVIYYIEKDFAGAGGNYRKDMGYSSKVSKDMPLYDASEDKRPLVSVLLGRDKYKQLYDEYIDKLYDIISTGTVVDEAKKLLGDYTATAEYVKAEQQLFSYLYP